jgi:hypothetical protein
MQQSPEIDGRIGILGDVGIAAWAAEAANLDAITDELLGVVACTVEPTRASLWLRPQAAPCPPR